ncbi:MAG: ribonuclease HII [Clostridia bacterium]|nr:ribonuclease HII [Clostridia bacterium]
MASKISLYEKVLELSSIDRSYWEKGLITCGLDEVGRGPLAGPVVSACVIMSPEHSLILGMNDSKKLTESRRIALNKAIMENALGIGISYKSEAVIDELNILNATRAAFVEAYYKAEKIIRPDIALLDYITGVELPVEMHSYVGGDSLCYSIAAASIVAKVERDAFMTCMDELYPEYGFKRNKGYGTKEHIEALKRYGPCPIHRRSFIKGIIG